MKKPLLGVPVIALTVLAMTMLPSITHASLFGHEAKVQWSEVPAVVQKTITAHADNGKVTKVEKEVKNKITIYEALVKTPTNLRIKLKVAEDGKLVELRYKGKEEKEISWDKVPKIVQQAFTENAQGGKVRQDEVEIDSRDGLTIYEGVADMPDKSTIKMKISSEGKLLEFKKDED